MPAVLRGDWRGGQGQRRENSWKAPAVIQVKAGSGFDLGDSSGGGEEWSEYAYVVKVEQRGFASELSVGCESERRVKKV